MDAFVVRILKIAISLKEKTKFSLCRDINWVPLIYVCPSYFLANSKTLEIYISQSVYNLLGETLSRLQQYNEAEKWFQASLASQPDHVPAHITYGKLLARNVSTVVSLLFTPLPAPTAVLHSTPALTHVRTHSRTHARTDHEYTANTHPCTQAKSKNSRNSHQSRYPNPIRFLPSLIFLTRSRISRPESYLRPRMVDSRPTRPSFSIAFVGSRGVSPNDTQPVMSTLARSYLSCCFSRAACPRPRGGS
jgi:tetratricopeptide (TPR) repeat protein